MLRKEKAVNSLSILNRDPENTTVFQVTPTAFNNLPINAGEKGKKSGESTNEKALKAKNFHAEAIENAPETIVFILAGKNCLLPGKIILLPGIDFILPGEFFILARKIIAFPGEFIILPGNIFLLPGETFLLPGEVFLLPGKIILLGRTAFALAGKVFALVRENIRVF